MADFEVREGRHYLTRAGKKVGPIVANWADSKYWPFQCGRMFYKKDGFSCPGALPGHRDADDLVAEVDA